MTRRARYGLLGGAAVLVVGVAVAAFTGFDDPSAESGATESVVSSACPTDGHTEPGAHAVFADPVGDAQAGHGDIGTVEVSESDSVATVETVARNLRDSDAVVFSLDTDCDAKDDFVLRVWNDGSTYLSQLTEEGVPITDLPASTTRRGSTYTTRFESREIGGATAFRFRVRVDTEEYEVHADLAPDDESSSWTFGGARA